MTEPVPGHWVATWTAAPQLTEPENMPPPLFIRDGRVLADSTVRQTIRVTLGGPRIRLRFSNAYGTAGLPLTEVRVALPRGGRAGIFPVRAGTSRTVTFGGRPGVVIPAGAQVVSDALDYPLAAGAVLTVTVYLAAGQDASGGTTSHPGARTTSYLVPGNHAGDDAEPPAATPVDHWYFLSGVEVLAAPGVRAVVMLGDSLTDGRGSTTNGNDRWPDQFFGRLRPGGATPAVAVLNQGIGGNRVLRDGAGPSALARLDRDVLAVSGAGWLVVFEGVNDIGTADPADAACKQAASDLVFGYEQIAARAHAAGVGAFIATLTPFGGNEPYDDPDGHREAARQSVNEWIRASARAGGRQAGGGRAGGGRAGDDTRFDGVLDFDRAVRDPAHPRRLRPEADTGDHLHLNPAGYRALAGAVPAEYLAQDTLERTFGVV